MNGSVLYTLRSLTDVLCTGICPRDGDDALAREVAENLVNTVHQEFMKLPPLRGSDALSMALDVVSRMRDAGSSSGQDGGCEDLEKAIDGLSFAYNWLLENFFSPENGTRPRRPRSAVERLMARIRRREIIISNTIMTILYASIHALKKAKEACLRGDTDKADHLAMRVTAALASIMALSRMVRADIVDEIAAVIDAFYGIRLPIEEEL